MQKYLFLLLALFLFIPSRAYASMPTIYGYNSGVFEIHNLSAPYNDCANIPLMTVSNIGTLYYQDGNPLDSYGTCTNVDSSSILIGFSGFSVSDGAYTIELCNTISGVNCTSDIQTEAFSIVGGVLGAVPTPTGIPTPTPTNSPSNAAITGFNNGIFTITGLGSPYNDCANILMFLYDHNTGALYCNGSCGNYGSCNNVNSNTIAVGYSGWTMTDGTYDATIYNMANQPIYTSNYTMKNNALVSQSNNSPVNPSVQAQVISGVGSVATIAISGVVKFLPALLAILTVLVLIKLGIEWIKRQGDIDEFGSEENAQSYREYNQEREQAYEKDYSEEYARERKAGFSDEEAHANAEKYSTEQQDARDEQARIETEEAMSHAS